MLSYQQQSKKKESEAQRDNRVITFNNLKKKLHDIMSKVTGAIADEIHEQDMYIEEKELVFRLSNVPIPLSKTIIEKSNFNRHFFKDNAPVKWKMVNFNCAMSEDRTKYYVKIYLYDVQRVHRLDLLSCWTEMEPFMKRVIMMHLDMNIGDI